MKELKSNPRRKAVAPLRGYYYQILQSVYAWITLTNDEVLFLEGAEDFDIHGQNIATAVQVKDTRKSGSVTLNSTDVIAAINHFWEHKNNNPNIKVNLRFLTTAKRGKEKDSPFGDIPGLDFWDSCRQEGRDVKPLRDFLCSHAKIDRALRTFIKNADDSQLRTDFISRIDWDTGNVSHDFLENLIERQLVYHGESYSIAPSESLKVLSHLLKHVFDTICKEKELRLDRYDFLILFEKCTSERVSKTELNILKSKSISILDKLINVSGASLPEYSFADLSAPLPLPSKISLRENIVEKFSKLLSKNSLLVLKGSTGMGKTTLASLIVDKTGQDWKWLQFRGKKPPQIEELLYRALQTNEGQTNKFVIDDLAIATSYENALIGFLDFILSRGGKVIITTQRDIPSRVRSIIKFGIITENVPSLNIEEIKELAQNYKCPSIKSANWSIFILSKTSGHPQLVHAKVRSLEAKGWPDPKPEDLIQKEEDIDIIRKEARDRLLEEIPDKYARTFAYILSIFFHPFRRDHAIMLSKVRPNIDRPGEAFDLLVGPWIEDIGSNYFRVSPLLANAATKTWSSEEIKCFHAEAASALTKCKPVNLMDASSILMHGISGGADYPTIRTVQSLLTSDRQHWKKIGEEFEWLLFVGPKPGQKIYPNNLMVNTALRFLQFRVATNSSDKSQALKIARLWEDDINEIESLEMRASSRLLFLVETLMSIEVPFSMRNLINWVSELSTTKDKTTLHLLGQLPVAPLGDLTATLFTMVIARCKSYQLLNELISVLDEQHDSIRTKLLSVLNTEAGWSTHLISQVWLNEAELQQPDWDPCIKALNYTIAKATVWRATSLVAAATSAIVVIQDEYLNDQPAALETIENAQKRFGGDHYLIEDSHATLLLHKEKYADALSIWERILTKWPSTVETSPVFSYRKAEQCAAELGNWEKAGKLALKGRDAAKTFQLKVMQVGFMADHAFALWKSNDKASSIQAFSKVLDAFAILPDPEKDIKSYALQKRIGHAIAWLWQDSGYAGELEYTEPLSACFTNPETDEAIKDYPLLNTVFLHLILANIEYNINSGQIIFHDFKAKYSTSNFISVNLQLYDLQIKHSLRSQTMGSLVKDFASYCDYLYTFKHHSKKKNDTFIERNTILTANRADFVGSLTYLLLTAFILLTVKGEPVAKSFKKLREDSSKYGFLCDDLQQWFDFIDVSSQLSFNELKTVMHDTNAKPGSRLLSAFLLSIHEDVVPAGLFYGNVLLVSFFTSKTFQWRNELECAIESIVTKGWLKVTKEQSFALLTPRINIPKIIDACNSSSKGFQKVAKILLAAKNATNISVQQDMLNQLNALADN